jgi:hypothetical protein
VDVDMAQSLKPPDTNLCSLLPGDHAKNLSFSPTVRAFIARRLNFDFVSLVHHKSAHNELHDLEHAH